MATFWVYLSVSVLMITGVLMIFIILLQRGRGGGLAGAFGGAGGQSALGTKAGDVFTRITIGLAVVWVFFACISIYALRYPTGALARELPSSVEQAAPAVEAAPPGEPDDKLGSAGEGAAELGKKPEKPATGATNLPSGGQPGGAR